MIQFELQTLNTTKNATITSLSLESFLIVELLFFK